MKKLFLASAISAALSAAIGSLVAAPADQAVKLVDRPADRRVDVIIDGKPFTSYIYPTNLEKPVLYPIRSAGGQLVTRGYPLDPRPGERADHPHHVGHWFNYGDVNGYDFWGHSSGTPARNKPKMGTIVHKSVDKATSGAARGELAVKADWNLADGSTLMKEETQFIFAGAPGRRTIDRITKWTATDKDVTFNDTKEGAFGIRVAHGLDHPSKQAETFVDASGQPEKQRRVNNEGATGQYIGSDGKTGEQVWGTRGPWMGLTGVVEGTPLTLAVFDHPSNHGHPTYWHARGYGLFAANPFGQQGYDPKQPKATFTLKPGQSVTFRHRILVLDGKLTGEQLAKEYSGYTASGTK
jgi:hypothetical protein